MNMMSILSFICGFLVGTVVLMILGRLLTHFDQAKTRKTLHPGKIIKIDDDLPELTEIDIDDIND